ncbi:MAG: 6-carboxytetrahydropterin synthase [Sphingobacteriales bacterium]|nr:6-carboxytetrahydropterin synthase [Sphingobacteriales bacterium]
MAHAIYGYPGACKNIHGHSYELHVTVSGTAKGEDYIPAPGFEIDFKEIKKLVTELVIKPFDHKLVLSRAYQDKNPIVLTQENLVTWEAEPTAENLLTYICQILKNNLPGNAALAKLKLFETKDSYAEWVNL